MRHWYLILFCLFSTALPAQTGDFSFRIYYQTTSTDPAVFDSLCNRVCEVSLGDTTNISAIEVKVGTTRGAANIIQHAFAFDVTQGLPAGLSYRREGTTVYLGLKQTTRSDMYYYEVRLRHRNGQYSETLTYF